MATHDEPLSIDIKRQVVYASLLRFAGEAQHLRARAIDQLVLAALAEIDSTHPLKTGELQKAVSIGAAQIRIETIQESLKRLKDAGCIDETTVRFKRAYSLTARGQETVIGATRTSRELLDSVTARIMRGLPADLPLSTAIPIFRRFLAECFARLGLEIAKTVTGRIGRDDLLRMPQIIEAFQHGCRGQTLSAEARTSLQSRCTEFLRSPHPDDERLKLFLTQGFFFTQLLGMQGSTQFDPLAEHAFSGAVLYLDTNTILPRLLHLDAAPIFEEMDTVARQLGVELRITRATVNEARRVSADRMRQLTTILEKGVPEDLLHRTNDQFLTAFLERRDRDGLTLEDFFAPFENLSDFVQRILRIELVELTEEEMNSDKARSQVVGDTIQQESEAVRHRRKGQATLEHDIAHFLYVESERRHHPKTWFLTHDRSVIRAASRLTRDNEPPISFSIAGFLQTISPFVTSGASQQSLADVFSSMLTDQMSPGGDMYDIEELVVLADLHEDVLTSGDDKVIQAFDVVRSTALRGERFRPENAQRAALELKKFLSSSTAERERVMIAERERLRGHVTVTETRLGDAITARDVAKDTADALRGRVSVLEGQIDGFRESDRTKQAAIDKLVADAQTRRRRLVLIGSLLIVASGIAVVWWNVTVAGSINASIPGLQGGWEYLLNGVRAVGLLMIAGPPAVYARRADLPDEVRNIILIVLFASVYALFPGVKDGWKDILSDPLAWLSLAVSLFATRGKKRTL